MKNVQIYVYAAVIVAIIAVAAVITFYFVMRSNTPVTILNSEIRGLAVTTKQWEHSGV